MQPLDLQGLDLDIDIVADLEIEHMKNFIAGANDTGFHYRNVNINRDFKPKYIKDIRTIKEGEPCPKCSAPVKVELGIEVGHIFKLGTKYSKALDCVYLDEDGKENLMVMGCYGIGVNRSMAAVIEQNNDDNGIIWPMAIAPYHVIVVPVNTTDRVQMETAEKIYKELINSGIEVLLDDRDERPGVKFKDADLIGIPIRITVGKKSGEGIIEYKMRDKRTLMKSL